MVFVQAEDQFGHRNLAFVTTFVSYIDTKLNSMFHF